MVAKMPLSNRRLITSLARTSSFSESSLMAMPSVIVILRVIGTSSGGTGLGGAGGGMPGNAGAGPRAAPQEAVRMERRPWPPRRPPRAARAEPKWDAWAAARRAACGIGGAHRRNFGLDRVRIDRLAGRGVAAHHARGSRGLAVRDGVGRRVRDFGSLGRRRWGFRHGAGARHGSRRDSALPRAGRCGRRRRGLTAGRTEGSWGGVGAIVRRLWPDSEQQPTGSRTGERGRRGAGSAAERAAPASSTGEPAGVTAAAATPEREPPLAVGAAVPPPSAPRS